MTSCASRCFAASRQARSASARSDLDRRPRDRPGSERGADRCGNVGISERKAEPDAAKPIALGERAQHEYAGQRQIRRKAQAIAFEIGEGLIDDQQPIAHSLSRQREQRAGVEASTIWIVRIAENSVWRIGKRVERTRLHHPVSRSVKAPRIFAIGGAEDRDRGMRKEPGQQRDQQLRAWDGRNHAPIRDAIYLCCHRL